jgi:prevent-host-death family protein
MDANIREIKANLSRLIRRVQGGETVTVRVRRRAVARIVPVATTSRPDELARTPGVLWKGGKPAGLARGERPPKGITLSDWVTADRR